MPLERQWEQHRVSGLTVAPGSYEVSKKHHHWGDVRHALKQQTHTGDVVMHTADFLFLSATCLPCMPSLSKRFYTVNKSKCLGLNWPALRQAHEQAGSGCSGPPTRHRLQAGSRPLSVADLPTAHHSLCGYPDQLPVFRSDCVQDTLDAWHASCD